MLNHNVVHPDHAESDNHNVMRDTYRELTAEERLAMSAIKQAATSLFHFIHTLDSSRELSLAKTKVEESVMWAVKHITR